MIKSNEVILKASLENPMVITNGNSDTLMQNAIFNIDNSRDVVVGSVSNFNAPVTIYNLGHKSSSSDKNEVDDDFIQAKSIPAEENGISLHKLIIQENEKTQIKSVAVPIAVIVLMLVLGLVTIFFIRHLATKDNKNEIDNVDKNETNGMCTIIKQKNWGHKPKYIRPLNHPTPLVIISHSVTPFCSNINDCKKIVLSMQEDHVGSLGSPDIGYNFIIGGDGNIYEGRGWDARNFHQDNSLGINFIGNYLYDELTSQMIHCTKSLLENGVQLGKLSKNYKLVGHNQTFGTQSPGPNVYAEIKTWPHFYNASIHE